MTRSIYEVYILDEDGEAIGTHYYCPGCAPDTAYMNGCGACGGIVCEGCGVRLVSHYGKEPTSYE